MKVKMKPSILIFIILLGSFLLFRPTWTPKVIGNNAISELSKVEVNGTKLQLMIRGKDKSNPIVIFVHGGPGCSEMPYVRKYQDLLEEDFTIIHYDQRGSGKSYHFFEDYSEVLAQVHVDDLLELTDYITKRFNQDQVILIGHSYGTYIGIKAAEQVPEKFKAYVGIGQVADTIASEIETLNFCIEEAEALGNTSDVAYLKTLVKDIKNGEDMVPRSYVRKYGGAARLINDIADMSKIYFSKEYNWLDAIRYSKGIADTQDRLCMELINEPLTESILVLDLPFYFVMGKHDGMTSAKVAKTYFDSINTTHTKEFLLYENAAHYPHFEEEEQFYKWMCDTFK